MLNYVCRFFPVIKLIDELLQTSDWFSIHHTGIGKNFSHFSFHTQSIFKRLAA